jgi:hypothetical protein
LLLLPDPFGKLKTSLAMTKTSFVLSETSFVFASERLVSPKITEVLDTASWGRLTSEG